jgi:molecular chaperone GrpE
MEKDEIKSSDSVPQPESGDNELAVCKKQCDEYLDGWKRTKADFINYKNDETARMRDLLKFGNESLLYDILPVFDSFDMGMAALKEDSEVKKGIKLICAQLEDIVKRHGLEPIEAPPGTPFDPARHEAIGETVSDIPEGMIAEETKRGYALHGKILRPAKVKIAKKS